MTYKIPVIPGDGVGPEVIVEGKKVIEAAAGLLIIQVWTVVTARGLHRPHQPQLLAAAERYASPPGRQTPSWM